MTNRFIRILQRISFIFIYSYLNILQREHAYRCYLAASKVFENHSWSLVEDHIHFTLGRQSFHLGDLDTSLKFFLKLLRASRQPATQQSAYLKEFLFIYKVMPTLNVNFYIF